MYFLYSLFPCHVCLPGAHDLDAAPRQGFLRLVAPDGHVLDPLQSLEEAGLGDLVM